MSWVSRFRNTFRPQRLDDDLADEIGDHLARRAADLEEQGLSAAEAQQRAVVVFGNVPGMREKSRETRLWSALEETLQDTRYAWRGLMRNPVFATTALISVSLAIGANTAVYSIVDALILRPLPVPQPENLFTLATLHATRAAAESSGERDTFSYPLYQALRLAAGDSAQLALFGAPDRVEAQGPAAGAPYEEVIEQYVSPNAFDVLGVPSAIGRLFSDREDRYPGPRPVVVLSHDYWQRRFGGDPAILGQNIKVDGRTRTVLGVARAGFSGAEPGKSVDLWLPVTLFDPGVFTNPAWSPYLILGRVASGVTKEQIAARLRLQAPSVRVHAGASGLGGFRRDFSRPLWILAGVALCILVIACANVASLLMARSVARSGEMALRVSLGAGRLRLVRQLLTESLLISFTAGVLGWLLARVAAPALLGMFSNDADPVRLDLALDSRVLAFSAIICALSAVFFGLVPALRAAGARPLAALRNSTGRAGGLRLGRVFVGTQVAFAFCLVTGGTEFLFSLHNLVSVETGFDARGVTVLSVKNEGQSLSLARQMQNRVGALPGVQSAAVGWSAIFSAGGRLQRVVVAGKAPSEREAVFYRVSPGYFATLRTPLLSGRDFEVRDNDDEPVPAIVNLTFARRYFGSEAVLGREFRRSDDVRHQIVGIAANSYYNDLRSGPAAIVYMPMKPPRRFTLYVRSSLDAGMVLRMVERKAAAMGGGLRVVDTTTLGALVGTTILKEKVLAAVAAAFALVGLILAAVGLFGLLNYTVTRRTKEIGIRAALGASRAPLMGLVFQDLWGMVGGGMAFGLAGSLALMRFARSLLFGIQTADPLVIGTAVAVFVGAAIIAGGLPARRAAGVDPLVALRHE